MNEIQRVEEITARDVAERVRAAGIAVDIVGDPTVTVSGLTHDSRAVSTGQMFVCVRGHAFDGHEFAAETVERGATSLLVDHELTDVGDTVQLVVEDTRLAVGPASAVAWGDPAEHLVLVGITGTNGKTTTTQIVAALLEAAGWPTGMIGTLHGTRTTPEAPDLHERLASFVDEGKRAVVMEVSSHALALHRIDGTVFDVVAFTNLGHDHLDLHGSPEAYFRAKSALFTSRFAPIAVINTGDTHGSLLADTISDRIGAEAMSVTSIDDTHVSDVSVAATRHSYTWKGRAVSVPLGGEFNVANSLMALSIVAELDIDIDAAIPGFASLAPVPGRFEVVETDETRRRGITVVVDYAHTPDGLERVIHAARELAEGRVIAVFGCAGRRDLQKRPVMGELAARLADIAIPTSDNPRGENPDAIVEDVVAGVAPEHRARVMPLTDRRIAIRKAIELAEHGDVIVIAGKGHETTQDLGAETIPFDDRIVAREELERRA
jgi:UDP-N-acetylmuramoyl-L-alanyl-D-glutamate--2,6-diaminopimelate ligase